MYHVQVPIDGDNEETNWRLNCNEKLTKLMEHRRFSTTEDNPSSHHPPAGQQLHLSAETFVSLELYEAVRNGNPNSFVQILEKVSKEKKLPLPAILDEVTRAGSSLLHVAAHFGRERIAELICQHFPEILTKQDIKGDTALHVAIRAKNNNLRVIKIIVDTYITDEELQQQLVRIKNEYGNTALHEAVICNHFDAVECIFCADQIVAHCLNKLGLSPFYLTVLTASDKKILTLLLKAPFEKDKLLPAFRGNSPLHAAILKKNSEYRHVYEYSSLRRTNSTGLIEYILEKRSELIHLRDEKGSTPLHYAASIGYLKGVQILLRKSTSSNALAWNKKGHLPIHVACKKGHVDIVKELLQLEWPTSMDMFSKKGQNILHVAAKNGQDNVVRFILKEKKLLFEKHLVNERDRNGNTALHLAAKHLYPQVLLSLTRDKRVDMQIMNNQGLTAQDIVLVRSKAPLKHREYLSLMILYSAGVPQSETSRSMLRRRKEPPKIDWIKDRINTLMLVAILIATVTFAAGFALPGSVYSSDDPDPKQRGMAVLVHKPMFQVFSVCNTVAMYSSTLGSFVLLWAQLGDFHLAGSAYNFALHMVAVALVTTSTAFMAAVGLVVSNVLWLANVITVIGSIFLLLIVFFYVLLIFPLGTRHPLMRHVAIILVRILIPFAGTYDKVIAKEHDSNSMQVVNKAKQQELMSDEISCFEDQ